jgi:hypothetical protein
MIIFSSHVRVFHLIQLYSARHILNISSTTDDRYYKFIQLLFLVPASKVVLDPRTTFFWHDMISYKYEYPVHTSYTIPTGTVHMYSMIPAANAEFAYRHVCTTVCTGGTGSIDAFEF